MLSLVSKSRSIVNKRVVVAASPLRSNGIRNYSDFKEIKPESEKPIDSELEAMIKNDQADIAEDEAHEETNKAPEEADVLIQESETPVGESVTKEFQAETKKILDIVARSLYSDKEIFIRELISNASDALEKVRHLTSVNSDVVDTHLPLEIHIACDEEKKTFTIQDYGIGMNKEELQQNLGKIGFSGTGEFAKILEDGDRKKNLIGQFGVGFYSAFMVGTEVRVYSKGYKEEGDVGHIWESDGSGAYKLTAAKGVSRGTKIVIQLRQESEEFSVKKTVENIVKTYSNFVGFNIFLNGKPVNTVSAVWVKQPQTVTEQEHKDFYQFIAKAYDSPKYTLHFMTDMPLQLQALFYVPDTHMEKYGMGRQEVGVSLFCRKVMIQTKCKGLLPDWLRFVKGVVDSEDVPLNISREHLQDSALIKRLSGVLTRRLVKFFEKEMKTNPEKYDKFYSEFGQFLKEGICTDYVHKEEIAKLLRVESSHLPAGKLTTLDDYIERMSKERSEIYYLIVPNRNFAETSPYFESFKAKDIEVLFLYDTRLDDFVFSNLAEFKGKKLKTIESSALDVKDFDFDKKDTGLNREEFQDFSKWMKDVLVDKITTVTDTERLSSTPMIIVDHESASFRRMMKSVDPQNTPELPKQQVQINARHPLIVGINQSRKVDETLAKDAIEQLFDNALIQAGLVDDGRSMVPRIHKILERALKNSNGSADKE